MRRAAGAGRVRVARYARFHDGLKASWRAATEAAKPAKRRLRPGLSFGDRQWRLWEGVVT